MNAPTIGVTGHSRFSAATAARVRRALAARLARHQGDLVGVTCLAPGADRIFADVVLQLGGAIEVVVPSADYFDQADGVERAQIDAYLTSASAVATLPFPVAGDPAYLAASMRLVDRCGLILAVWDGRPGSGTADAVDYAHAQGRPVDVIWPAGATREAAA